MVNYEGGRIKLINTQLNKLRFVGKNKTGTTLSIGKKTFKMKFYKNFYKKLK